MFWIHFHKHKIRFPTRSLVIGNHSFGNWLPRQQRFSRAEVAVGVGMFSADSCFFLISCTAHMSLHAYTAFSHTKMLLLCTLQKCLPLPCPSAVLSCTAATHTNTKATVISGTQERVTLSNLLSNPILTVAAQQNPEQNTLSVYPPLPPPFLILKREWWSFSFRSWTGTTVYHTYTNLQLKRNDSTYDNSEINTVGCILLVSPINTHFDSICGIHWYRPFTEDSLHLIVQSETDRSQECLSVIGDRESWTTHCHDIIN